MKMMQGCSLAARLNTAATFLLLLPKYWSMTTDARTLRKANLPSIANACNAVHGNLQLWSCARDHVESTNHSARLLHLVGEHPSVSFKLAFKQSTESVSHRMTPGWAHAVAAILAATHQPDAPASGFLCSIYSSCIQARSTLA